MSKVPVAAVVVGAIMMLGWSPPGAAAESLTGKISIVHISIESLDTGPWQVSLESQLIPFHEIGVDLVTEVEWTDLDDLVPPRLQVTVVEGFALKAGELRLYSASGEHRVNVALGESAAIILSRVPSSVAVATFADSALIVGPVSITSSPKGIAVVTAPLFDWSCDLSAAEATLLAKGVATQLVHPLRMIIVPTRNVLCHWAASGYETLLQLPLWRNTSFVPYLRTNPESGLYREFLPAHELGHILLDGGNAEVHAKELDSLMHHTGGYGLIYENTRRRMLAESGPEATPPLLSGPMPARVRGRFETRVPASRIASTALADECSCSDTTVLRALVAAPLADAYSVLVHFLCSDDNPVARYPAVVAVIEEEVEDSRELWLGVTRRASGVHSPVCPAEREEVVTALLVAAASGGVVCTGEALSVRSLTDSRLILDTLSQVVVADETCDAWTQEFGAKPGSLEALQSLERYLRNGFNFNTGQESLDLYGGGQPVVRWAREQFSKSVDSRAQIRSLLNTLDPIELNSAYEAYLFELADL